MSPSGKPPTRIRRLWLTRGGLMLSAMTVVAFLPAYAMSVSLMFLMGAMFMAMIIYNFFSVVGCLGRLNIQLIRVGEMFATHKGTVVVRLHAKRRRGKIHHLRLILHGRGFDDLEQVVATLPGGQDEDVAFAIRPKGRGRLQLEAVTLVVAHPFGLVYASRRFLLDHQVLVYPTLLSDSGRMLYAERERQGLVPRSSDDFVYLTRYQPGEDVRRIHWKKSTLLDYPVLKKDLAQFEVVVPRLFVPDPCPHFEFALSVLATHFANEHHLDGWQVLTDQGLLRAESREEMLNILALLKPYEGGTERYESRGYEMIFASSIQP